VLTRLEQAVQGRYDITLLSTERNLGVAGGRNLISGLGHGRVIVALDNDAEFASPDTVAQMVAVLDAEPRLGAIGCRIVTYASGDDDLSSWGYPIGLLPSAGESFDTVTYVGAGHAIRREAWQQAGGYDAKLFFCWEEFDFCLRAIALGWHIRYRGDIVVRHKVCAEQRVGWDDARWFYFVRNRIYIERKLDHSWFALLPRIAGYMVKGTCNGLPSRRCGRSGRPLIWAPARGAQCHHTRYRIWIQMTLHTGDRFGTVSCARSCPGSMLQKTLLRQQSDDLRAVDYVASKELSRITGKTE
jgi:GT2 family glycosyltransferase